MKNKTKNELFNVPNLISMFRLVCAPLVILFYLLPIKNGIGVFIALGIFIIGSVSDIVDGYIARKYNLVTDFGKFIDSIADKFLQTTGLILVCMTNIISINWLAIIILTIIILRDIVINGLRQILSVKGKVLAADFYGKLKTIFIDVAIIVLMLYKALILVLEKGDLAKILGMPVDYIMIFGFTMLIVGTLLCLISCVNYIVRSLPLLTNNETKSEEK